MWSFESLLLWKRNVMIFCYGFIMLFVASVHPVTATLLQMPPEDDWFSQRSLRVGSSFYHTCLDLCVVLVKLIVDGCFCSDLLSTGWSAGNRSLSSIYRRRTTSGRKSGWCFWIWTVLKIRLLYLDLDYKARSLEIVRVSCPVCLREGFAGRDAVESTQERASHQLQSAQFILLFQPVQQHALLIPHQQRFVQSTACPAQIRWVWSWCSEWRVCHFRFFSVSAFRMQCCQSIITENRGDIDVCKCRCVRDKQAW